MDEPTPVPPRPPIEEAPTARTLKGLDAGEVSAVLTPAAPSVSGTPPEAAAVASDPARQINHYILVAQVGAGGMGAVWKASVSYTHLTLPTILRV